MKYTEHARYYASTWHLGTWQPNDIHYDQSPVLRYTLYALLLKLTRIPDYQVSFRISLFLTSIFYFVLSPYILFAILKDASGTDYAWAGLAGWVTFQFVQWPVHLMYGGTAGGKWQYCYIVPLLLAALYFPQKYFQTNKNLAKNSIKTGVLVGIAGLTQYTYTLAAALALFLILGVRREWRFLGIFSMTGLPFVVYMLVASSPEHFTTTFSKATGGSGGVKPVSEVLNILFIYPTSSRLIWGSVILVTLLALVAKQTSGLALLESVFLTSFTMFFISSVSNVNPGGIRYAMQFLIGTIGFSLFGYVLLSLRKKLDMHCFHQQVLMNTTTVNNLIAALTLVLSVVAALFISPGTGVFAGLAVVSGIHLSYCKRITNHNYLLSRTTKDPRYEISGPRIRTLTAVGFSVAIVTYVFFTFPIREVLLDGPPGRQMALLLHLAVAGLIVAAGTRPGSDS